MFFVPDNESLKCMYFLHLQKKIVILYLMSFREMSGFLYSHPWCVLSVHYIY